MSRTRTGACERVPRVAGLGLRREFKRAKSGYHKKWIRYRGFSTWGIQIGPIAACGADFVPKFYYLPTIHTGESKSLLPQRERKAE